MEWYIFALLAPAFWALDNVFIKFLITNKFKSYYSTIAIISTADVVFALAISALTPIAVNFPFSVLALLAGLLPLTAFWFYSQAMLIEDVSRVVTLFQLIPVFVVFLSVVFLNEVLGVQRYLGIGLVLVAATLISYKKSGGKAFSRSSEVHDTVWVYNRVLHDRGQVPLGLFGFLVFVLLEYLGDFLWGDVFAFSVETSQSTCRDDCVCWEESVLGYFCGGGNVRCGNCLFVGCVVSR